MPEPRAKVIIRDCQDYDVQRMQTLIHEGMEAFGYQPHGRTFLKPNVVYAWKEEVLGKTAYTAREVLEAALGAVGEVGGVTRVTVGENSAIGLPTRFAYYWAGYKALIRRLRRGGYPKRLKLVCLEEDRRDKVFVGGAVHDTIRLSRHFHRADTRIYLPKLKRHCVTNMTGAVKLNVGIVGDDERAVRHDFKLNDKIVDLLRVGQPDFIVMDAIDVGAGNEGVPYPRRLGLLIMGTDPVAVDLVATRLMGYTEDDVGYLKSAMEAGFGPSSLDAVEIDGDYSSTEDLSRLAERIKPYDDQWNRWGDLGHELARLKSPMRLHFGSYDRAGPQGTRCETGCVMALKMMFASFERFSGPESFAKGRPLEVVVGKHEQPIDCEGRAVFLLGACTDARLVRPGKKYVVRQCFTSASDLGFTIGAITQVKNMFLAPSFFFGYARHMLSSMLRKLFNGKYFQEIWMFFTERFQKKI